MTKEQIEACEKAFFISNTKLQLGPHRINEIIFNEGFQAAQTPEMLMLNPLVKGLVSIVEKEAKMMSQLREDSGVYIGGISLAEKALAPFGKSDD